jgi:hypothetical protein
MAEQPDWGKRGVVAAWVIGGVSIGMAILSYAIPPDPAHPMHFDFLTRSFTIPLWLAAIILLGTVGATAWAIYHWGPRRPDPPGNYLVTIAPPAPSPTDVKPSAPRSPKDPEVFRIPGLPFKASRRFPFVFDPKCEPLVYKWPEGLSVQVELLQRETRGCLLTVANDTTDYISAWAVDVADANSWNETHKTFLPNSAFNRCRINAGTNLGPMHKSNGQWIVKLLSRQNATNLSVGADDQRVLNWPNNDPTNRELWRFTIAVSFDRLINLGKTEPQGLKPVYLVVRWDRHDNSLLFTKYDQQA